MLKFDHSAASQILREIKFKRTKNVIFGNFRDSERYILVNVALEGAQIY